MLAKAEKKSFKMLEAQARLTRTHTQRRLHMRNSLHTRAHTGRASLSHPTVPVSAGVFLHISYTLIKTFQI